MMFNIQILNFALDTVAHLNPEYVPAINWLKSHEDEAAKVIPVIDAAIRQGGSALAAVQRDAPDLYKAIVDLVDASQAPQDSTMLHKHAENTTRMMFGFPRMTPEQEQAWMDRTTAGVNDLRTGGG